MIFRLATPADAYALAELTIMAGDGLYEFLLEELAPREMLPGLMARGMKQDTGGCCWRHAFVADAQGVVGMVNAYPAVWLLEEDRSILPHDRVEVLDPIDQAQDWKSFLVNAVAVRPAYRRKGIGERLLQWAVEQANTGGFDRLTANVWQDNLAARGLFEKSGFHPQLSIEVPVHPGLNHVGGSLLMVHP